MNNLLNKKIIQFAIISYLFQISFLLSLSHSLYYLTFFSRNQNVTIFGYFSFSIILIIAFFSDKFQKTYMKLILNDFTVSVAFKLKEFLVLAQKRYFNWCFTVFIYKLLFLFFIWQQHYFIKLKFRLK